MQPVPPRRPASAEAPPVVRSETPAPPASATPERRMAIFWREAARKVIHVTTASAAALLVWVLPPGPARILFLVAALLALAIDLARLRLAAVGGTFQRLLAPMLREKESGRITGATTLAIGFALVVLAFPRYIAIAALAYAGYADAAGALVGRAFGVHRYRSGKSVEGTVAFALVAFLVGWALPALGLAEAAAVAVALAALESAPLPIDDNLLVPVAGAALTYIASALL